MRLFLPLFAFATLLFLAQCGTGKPEIIKVNPAFGKYISGYTAGMVSRGSTIKVEVKNVDSTLIPEDGSLIKDTNVIRDIFQFEPAIEGRTRWADNHTIEFVPAGELPEGQFYAVHFELGKVSHVKPDFEDFHFQFSTYQQNIFVEIEGLYDYDDYSFGWKEARGRFTISDDADMEKLTQVFSATLDGKNLPVRIEEGYQEHQYFVYVDSIERREKAGNLVVSWNGEPINAFQSGSEELEVPAFGDFSVDNIRVHDREDQSVEIIFTEPIQQQDLKGLITLEGVEKLTFGINGNAITAYLPNRIVGNKKLEISAGIKNQKGYSMSTGKSEYLVFREPKPLVRLKGNGCILPSTNGLIFPFEAISLRSVDVRVIKIYETNVHNFLQVNNLDSDDELQRFGKVVASKKIRLDYDASMNLKTWNTHVIDLDKLIRPDRGAIYRVSIKFSKDDAITNCTSDSEDGENEESAETEQAENSDPNWSERSWYGFDDGFSTWYDYGEDYDACDDSYYYGKAVSRNILASDLGMICKIDDNKVSHAYVSDLLSAAPQKDVTVQYYDFTKQLIAEGKTDANGMYSAFLTRKPFLMIARRGDQRGYLKLNDGNSNSMSQFDIEGEDVQDGVKGFLYAERGVWRPGDSIYINLILQDPDHKLPAGHPVKFELHDPNGTTVQEFVRTTNVNGTFDLATATSSEAMTGFYTAVAKVGNRVFSKSLMIETVKPNRLKIYLDVSEKNARDSLVNLDVKWLHGALAGNLRTTIEVTMRGTKTTFPNFKGYVFDSPIRTVSAEKQLVYEGTLDGKGHAQVPLKVNVSAGAPGKLKASYLTKAFEKGGDFSIDRKDVTYSPYERYVGLRSPAANTPDHSLETGKRNHFDIAVVDENGKLSPAERLQVKIYKLEWRFWYERGEENLGEYIARSGALLYRDTIVSASNGKAGYDFMVDYPEYGRFLVTVTDLDGKHQTGEIVTIDWPYWNRGNRKENTNASMLSFSVDKERYTKGDQVHITFPSSEGGRALISVESSRKVLHSYWITTTKGETQTSFVTTGAMAPNAYVHVTMVQKHATTVNDLPIRMYGVVPIIVDDPETHLHPVIAMADEIRPESTVNINVREADGKKMTYTLALVDEGLLNLTGFRTPNPHTSFYAREALKVKTWDMYDYVIGAFAGKLDKLLSIGGDQGLKEGEGAKANRFKPVVTHLGPFVVEPGKTASHKITLPNYMGAVRVMVVAQQDMAYGSAEKSVQVKSPVMVLATLPRVLGPGETVTLPVDVFATEKNIRNVKVTIETNDFLSAEQSSKSVTFDEPTDEVVNFDLKVAKKLGIAKIKVIAVSGSERSTQELEVDVRTPNPLVTTGEEVVIQPGKSWTGNVSFAGISGTNRAVIELSSLPSIGLQHRLNYLIQYPHGCIEQTTSAAFPQLYVSNLTNVDQKQLAAISKNVKAAIRKLSRFQTGSGGFSYWPGEYSASDWGTNYAGHFMIEAEKAGYAVSGNLKSHWLQYQSNTARSWTPQGNQFVHAYAKQDNELIQAYRLYTLALAGKPENGAMNRLREVRNLSETAKWRLAAAYQLSGLPDIARQLTANLKTTVTPYRELSYSYGSTLRDQALILEALSLTNQGGRATALVNDIAKKLGSDDWYSTQETAWSLIALTEYAGGRSNALQATLAMNGGTAKTVKGGKPVEQFIYGENAIPWKSKTTIKNTGSAPLYVKVMVEGKPLIGDSKSSESNLQMDVAFTTLDGSELDISKIEQGTDFVAVVTLTNPGKKGLYKEMALTQIFPSGWEIHNSRIEGSEGNKNARYEDIRDDRVYMYYDLAPNATKIFKVHLNATYLGRYYLPSFYSEAMYDHLINAKSGGKWVEIVPQGSRS